MPDGSGFLCSGVPLQISEPCPGPTAPHKRLHSSADLRTVASVCQKSTPRTTLQNWKKKHKQTHPRKDLVPSHPRTWNLTKRVLNLATPPLFAGQQKMGTLVGSHLQPGRYRLVLETSGPWGFKLAAFHLSRFPQQAYGLPASPSCFTHTCTTYKGFPSSDALMNRVGYQKSLTIHSSQKQTFTHGPGEKNRLAEDDWTKGPRDQYTKYQHVKLRERR